MNIALLTAAGRGTRMKQEIPKQFATINNKPLIIYTLEAFQRHPNIDAIIVPCLNGWEPILEAYAKQYKITKLKWIIPGGNGGNGPHSIYLGLKELQKHCSGDDVVLIHDGNRPLISNDVISNSIVTCKEKGSAVAVVPCNEVIVRTSNNETSNECLERDTLKRTQTPHTYPLEKLLWAYEQLENKKVENVVATCDLMIKLGEKVNFSLGSEKNIKITTPEDVELFKALSEGEDN